MSNQDKVIPQPLKLTPADFASKSEPRWCPGCGDYSIYAQMKKSCQNWAFQRKNLSLCPGSVVQVVSLII